MKYRFLSLLLIILIGSLTFSCGDTVITGKGDSPTTHHYKSRKDYYKYGEPHIYYYYKRPYRYNTPHYYHYYAPSIYYYDYYYTPSYY